MKSSVVFLTYFLLGFFLVFSYKHVARILNFQQLKSPLPHSFFSLDAAPSRSLKGTIVYLTGNLAWQSRIATQPAKITKPMQIQQGEGVVTKETGQANIIFSDQVSLTIYPKTEINFIQTLPSDILIEQKSGIAEYAKLDSSPLSIRAHGLLAEINLGNISILIDEKQPHVIINVKSGSATVAYNDLNYITKVLIVAAGNRLIFQTITKKISVVSI